MLYPVRGSIVDELLRSNGGELVFLVKTDDLAPDLRKLDYIGAEPASEETTSPGDCVVIRTADGAEALCVYDRVAGEPALIPIRANQPGLAAFREADIVARVLWLYREPAPDAGASAKPQVLRIRRPLLMAAAS